MIVLEKVLVATDFSEPSEAALAYGREPAFTFGAQLVVAHVAENTLTGGSVAERVVRTAPCPVLTVRHPQHEFVLPDALAAFAGA